MHNVVSYPEDEIWVSQVKPLTQVTVQCELDCVLEATTVRTHLKRHANALNS